MLSWPAVKASSHLLRWHFWQCSFQLLCLFCSVPCFRCFFANYVLLKLLHGYVFGKLVYLAYLGVTGVAVGRVLLDWIHVGVYLQVLYATGFQRVALRGFWRMVKIEEVCRYCIEICMGGGKKASNSSCTSTECLQGSRIWAVGGGRETNLKH